MTRQNSRRLIGRSEELTSLTGALNNAKDGQAGIVFVSGPAGVGKTRLVDELSATARAAGHTVLTGQCAELGETMPYLPLTDALWRITRDPDAPPSLLEAVRARPALNRLLPSGDAGLQSGSDAEVARQQMFGAVLSLLGELADGGPVLFILEDLHWADRSTRDLLTFLSRMLQRERVCVLATYRSDDLHRRHPLRPVIAELLRLPGVSGIDVRPLPPIEMADYLTSLTGKRPAPEVLDRVIERAEGNPFYAGELLAAVAEGAAGTELPAGLADLLLGGVERLSELAQQVVRVAAVAGRRVDDDLVRAVSGLDQAQYEQASREVVSHQLLIPGGDDSYSFRHALLREAIYADLLPAERTRLHAAFAALLGEGDPHAAAELAHHSLASHNLPAALKASVTAGRDAERLGAPADAHQHFDQALELWDAVPDAERLAGLDRPHLQLRAAEAAAYAGDAHWAVTRLRRLAGQLADAADAEDALRAEVLERLAHYLSDLQADEDALEVASASLALLPADPPTPLRARALATYARTLLCVDAQVPEVAERAEEAIATARASATPDAEASGLTTLGLYAEGAGETARSQELFTSAWEAADRARDLTVGLRAAYHRTRADFERGRLTQAAARADEGVRFAIDNGLAWSTFGLELRFVQYLVHYTSGEWDRAEALADSFGIRGGTVTEATASACALFIEVARGSETVRERLSWLEPYWSVDDLVTYIAPLAAEHILWEGAEDAAIEHIAAALGALRPGASSSIRIAAIGLQAYGRRAARARAAGDATAEQDAILAADGLIEKARWSKTHASTGPRTWLGVEERAWLVRAEAEWNRVRGTDDPEQWRASVAAFDYGFIYEMARSRWRLAECLLEHGRRTEAEAEWRQARAVADRLDAAPLLRALDKLAHRARFARDGQEHARSGPLTGLTSREREVLRLVAGGQSNREIATSLFISPKTASVHLSNILTKLGATNRTQAAAIAHREGLAS